MRNKLHEIHALSVKHQEVQIIVLNETWLYTDEIRYFNLQGYAAEFNCKDSSRGGGAAIYIKKGLDYSVVFKGDRYNTILIEIKTLNGKTLNIMTMYRSPNENTMDYIRYLENKLDSYKELIFIGDTNIDLLKNDRAASLLSNMTTANNYRIVNKIEADYYTRQDKTIRTIIDHCITDLSHCYKIQTFLQTTAITDHRYMIVHINNKNMVKKPMTTSTITLRIKEKYRFHVKKLLTEIEHPSIENVIDIIKKAKTLSTTLKKIRTRSNSWITSELIMEMKERDLLYSQMKKNPTDQLMCVAYQRMRNRVTASTRRAKENYINDRISLAGRDSRKLWQVINKDILNKEETKSASNIQRIIVNSKSIERADDIANKLNTYFNGIGTAIQEDIPRRRPVDNPMTNNSIFMTPTSMEEVESVALNLKKKAAPGKDGITTEDITDVIDIIKKPLSELINEAMSNGKFPTCLKDTIVIPILKGGDPAEMNNYRPIALISNVGKIYEKIVENRIRKFIAKNGGFDNKQFGFQEHSSTELAASETLNLVNDYLDMGYYVGAVFIDLTKAFDTVHHNVLLNTLYNLGIRGSANDLMRSYLSGRPVVTRVNDVMSDHLVLKCGVPQGSILGPLLYLLYINNIKYTRLRGEYHIFADDTNLIYRARNAKELENIMNNDLKIFKEWTDGNKLKINEKKTKYMIFYQKNKADVRVSIKIGDEQIVRANEVAYLGLLIDDKLSWKKHIEKLGKTLTPLIGVLKRNIKLHDKIAHHVYNAHILSRIRYCILIWSQCSQRLRTDVKVLINRALKALYGLPWYTATQVVYRHTRQLTLGQIIRMEKAKFMHKLINRQMKTNLVIMLNSNIHNYTTRNRNNIRPMQSRTERKRKGLLNTAAEIYNTLPDIIKSAPSMAIFIKRLKNHLLEEYNDVYC